MKKLLLILLCLPMIGFGQRKKELRSIIENKNDTLQIYSQQIENLNQQIEGLNQKINSNLGLEEIIQSFKNKNQKLKTRIDALELCLNIKSNNDTVLLCALSLTEFIDTINKDRWGELLRTKKQLMFYNCEPFTGTAISFYKNEAKEALDYIYYPSYKGGIDISFYKKRIIKEILNYQFGQISALKEYYSSGQIYKEGKYAFGEQLTREKKGYWKTWHDNGKLASIEFHSVFFTNGSGQIYSVGCHESECEQYDENGSLINPDCCVKKCWDKNGEKIDCN